MPVYKDKKNGKWYVMVRYKDWTGANKQKCHEDFVKYAFSHCNTEIIWEARKIGCLLQLFCRVK